MRLHMNMNVLELGRRMHLFWHYKNSPLLPSSFKMKPKQLRDPNATLGLMYARARLAISMYL